MYHYLIVSIRNKFMIRKPNAKTSFLHYWPFVSGESASDSQRVVMPGFHNSFTISMDNLLNKKKVKLSTIWDAMMLYVIWPIHNCSKIITNTLIATKRYACWIANFAAKERIAMHVFDIWHWKKFWIYKTFKTAKLFERSYHLYIILCECIPHHPLFSGPTLCA